MIRYSTLSSIVLLFCFILIKIFFILALDILFVCELIRSVNSSPLSEEVPRTTD